MDTLDRKKPERAVDVVRRRLVALQERTDAPSTRALSPVPYSLEQRLDGSPEG
ncbi:hypothetical protein [Truepera radiovictrix]|uniref:Uncharacterized protein n=1 Tax=Truepera radiovictrix (strain DSM 17093 / CIP 108686 / LMG 22925 / RQ-24) TaxID=649638 RepID=D7CUR1_TRURR|nr:hypothetical protein [Truepera radiovictrix]ADI14052.1 hypothetical protein Trad_0919 [Truepera radiovictrix DSM 17093]WMT57387.1 hypothetical protein RCV51_00225 [Truepera radiovictrix]